MRKIFLNVKVFLVCLLSLSLFLTITGCRLEREPAHEHILTKVEAVQATNEEDGMIQHWLCQECGKYFADLLGETEISIDDIVVPSFLSVVDFIVEIEDGRNVVVLQLTDPQIIDVTQKRTPDRLNAYLDSYWATDKLEDRMQRYIRKTIQAVNPDFIIVTGDIVYGEFDDNGTALLGFINFMEGFGIPWAPVLGNHEAESKKGVDWQCAQFENAQNCLFKQRTLTGNGNYTVGISQGGEIKRIFFMLDSNGTAAASAQSLANGHTVTNTGFGNDQVDWFMGLGTRINKLWPETKISFAFHTQPYIFKSAFEKYGFTNSGTIDEPINIDKAENKSDDDFGYLGRDLKGAWDTDFAVWNKMKMIGVDSVFVGHEHCNSASVVYEGVRFQYGQKSSTYDRANYVIELNGRIVGSYAEEGIPLVGGTVIPLSQSDCSIIEPYIYLAEEIDWSQWDVDGEYEIAVEGLQIDEALSVGSGIYIMPVKFSGSNAYKVVASSQDKLFVDTSLLQNKNSFTFSVYVPSTSNNMLVGLANFP